MNVSKPVYEILYQLFSPGISISVSGPWITVHTAKHSLLTLMMSTVDSKIMISPYFADKIDRDGLHHIELSEGTGMLLYICCMLAIALSFRRCTSVDENVYILLLCQWLTEQPFRDTSAKGIC
jgi:hypothetical protein